EVVVDQLFSGTTHLSTALQPLVTAAAQTLELDAAKRARTIVRVDAGGGSLDDLNWLLRQGYAVHGKEYSSRRAQALATSVTEWIADPACRAARSAGSRPRPPSTCAPCGASPCAAAGRTGSGGSA